MNNVFRTSEFWMGLVALLAQYLVTAGALPATVFGVSVANFIVAAFTYVLGRIFSKAAKAMVKP